MYPHIDGEQAKLELDFSASLASTTTYMHVVDDVIGLHDVDDDDEEDDEDDDDCDQLTATTTSRSSMTSGGSSSSSSSGSNDSSEPDIVDEYCEGLDEVDGPLQIMKTTAIDHNDLLKNQTHAIKIIVRTSEHLSVNDNINGCLTTISTKPTALRKQDIITVTNAKTDQSEQINNNYDSNNQIKSTTEQYNNHKEASIDQSLKQSNELKISIKETNLIKPDEQNFNQGESQAEGIASINIDRVSIENEQDGEVEDNEEDEKEEGGEDDEDDDCEAQLEDEENEDVDDEEDEDDDDEDDEEESEDEDEDDDEDETSNDSSQNGQENLYTIDDHHHYPLHHFNLNPQHHQSLHHIVADHPASLFQNSTQNHLSHHNLNHQHHHHLHLGQSFDHQNRYDPESHHHFSKPQQDLCQINSIASTNNHLQQNINHSNHQNANNNNIHHHAQYRLADESSGQSQQYYMTNGVQHQPGHHEFHQIHQAHHHNNISNTNDVTNDILIDLIPQISDDCSDLRSSETDICSNDVLTIATTVTTNSTASLIDSTITTTIATSSTTSELITSSSNNNNPNISIESNNTITKSAIASTDGDDDVVDGERMLEVTRKLVRSTERDPDRDLRKQVLLKTAIKKLPHFMEYNSYNETLDQTFHHHNNSLNMSQQHVCYEQHDMQPKFYHSVQPNAIQMSTTSLRMLDINDDDQDKEGLTTTTTTLTTTTPTATDYVTATTIETSLESNEESSFYHNHNSSHDSGVALFSPRSNKRSSSWIGLDDEMEVDNLTELSTRSQNIESNNLQHIKKLRKKEIMD